MYHGKMSDQALAHRSTVTDLVGAYQDAKATIAESFGALHAAEQRLNAVFTMGKHTGVCIVPACYQSYSAYWSDADGAIAKLERELWKQIVERLQLRRMMSVRAWKDLEKQLNEGELPELTVDNAMAIADNLVNQVPAMIEEAVVEVYDWLRPRYNRDKTNTQFEVGRKVILELCVEQHWGGKYTTTTTHNEQKLTALENVFTSLDGKGQVSKGYYSLLSQAIREAEDGQGRTEYFRFKCFKNKNLHLEFLHEDLLAKFNAVAGGARLRGDAPGERKSA